MVSMQQDIINAGWCPPCRHRVQDRIFTQEPPLRGNVPSPEGSRPSLATHKNSRRVKYPLHAFLSARLMYRLNLFLPLNRTVFKSP